MDGLFAVYDREPARPGIPSLLVHPRCFTWGYCRRWGRSRQEQNSLFTGVYREAALELIIDDFFVALWPLELIMDE